MGGALHSGRVARAVRTVNRFEQRWRVTAQQRRHLLKQLKIIPHAAERTVVIVNIGHNPRRFVLAADRALAAATAGDWPNVALPLRRERPLHESRRYGVIAIL